MRGDVHALMQDTDDVKVMGAQPVEQDVLSYGIFKVAGAQFVYVAARPFATGQPFNRNYQIGMILVGLFS